MVKNHSMKVRVPSLVRHYPTKWLYLFKEEIYGGRVKILS